MFFNAFRYVKDKRPTISPNFNFLGQLLEFEKELKREKELNNNSPNAIAQKSEARPWSNYVMDLSSHSPSSPVAKNLRPFMFETYGSQGLSSGSVSQNVSDIESDANEQKSTEKRLGTEQTSDSLVQQRDCPFPSSSDETVDQSKDISSKVVRDVLSFTFPLDYTRSRTHPCTLSLDASRRSPFSFPSEMSTSKSLTQISEVTECDIPSPLALPSGESTITTSYVQYQSKSTETFKPIFPCGERSTIVKGSSGMEVDQSFLSSFSLRTMKNSSEYDETSSELTESENNLGFLRKSKSCMSRISDTSSSLDLSRYRQPTHLDSPVIPHVKSTPSPVAKFGGKKPLRTSLSLSLSPIVPTKLSSSDSGENKSSSSLKLKTFSVENKTEVKVSENTEKDKSGKNNLRTQQTLSNIPSYDKKTKVTMSQKVSLKSFSVTSANLTLGAHSPSTPTASLAKLNFSVSENEKHGKKYETKIETFVNDRPPESNENNNMQSKSDQSAGFYSFPTTSLDKLNFTPCFSRMSEKDFMNDQNSIHASPPRTSGVKRPLNNNVTDLQDEDATSPMSVSSTTSTSSNSSHTSNSVSSPMGNGVLAKVAVRKRERKPNKPNVRPNSIAFSKYPTFDLGSDCQDSPNSSSSGTSQDDSSEIYIQNGKKSKPSEYMSDIRFRLGRYCEREVYMQITAAMESAMMKSQAFEATRKSRSLDDILSSEDDSSSPNCECSTFDRVLRHCALTRDRYSAPAVLFESLACRGSSDPYNSNSSLSSGGSHTSLHGSVELIQVS